MILVALLAANLPFLNERLFGVLQFRHSANKAFKWRLLELLVCYLLVGSLAFALESRAGNRFDQQWEFYAITLCLFLVLAFPGFVYRYLRKSTANA